jgi:dTMP kinase
MKFITFEGIEGCGKSTQAKKLHEFFLAQNRQAILTREPGGSAASEAIRHVLLSEEFPKLEAKSEVFLNFAARIEHVEKTIKPALAAGRFVVCDRFFDSTYAYQSSGFGVDERIIDQARSLAIGDCAPDITFLIDVPVEVAFARIEGREGNNRYEKLGLDFHQKVRDGFLKIAAKDPRVKLIDGSKNQQEVQQEILKQITNL